MLTQNKFFHLSPEGTKGDFSEELANLHYEGQCTCIKHARTQGWAFFYAIIVLELSPLQQ